MLSTLLPVLRRRIVLAFLVLASASSVTSIRKCQIDSECPSGQVCRMICDRTCTVKCVIIKSTPTDAAVLASPSSTSAALSAEEPFFTVDQNPFGGALQRDDEPVTPLTISESELEEELRESLRSTTGPEPPESVTDFPLPPPNVTDGVFPPSESPRPPSISAEHESGYLPAGHSNTASPLEEESEEEVPATSTAVSVTAQLLPQTPATLQGNELGYENGHSGIEHGAFENQLLETSTSASEATTTFLETGTFADLTPTLATNVVPAEPLNSTEAMPDCLAPPVCDKNCGVFVDENGCQSCQCLWLGIPCETSSDCVEEGQHCDLGRCECMPGYIQDMLQSGICKAADAPEDLQNIAEVHESATEVAAISEVTENDSPSAASVSSLPVTSSGYMVRALRLRRSQTPEKPTRMERLQWPGPCDRDSQCPPPLYCIQGDCWHLPDKPLRSFLEDASPESFPVPRGFDEAEAFTTTPLPERPMFVNFNMVPHKKSHSTPPPQTLSAFKERIDAREEPQPPSLRPIDDDEEEFLGPFGVGLDSAATTTPAPTKIIHMPNSIKGDDRDFEAPSLPLALRFANGDFPKRNRVKQRTEGRVLERVSERDADRARAAQRLSLSGPTQPLLPFPKNRNPHVDPLGWKLMTGLASPVTEFPPASSTPRDPMAKVNLDYSRRNRMGRPVRVEMAGAKEVMRDECTKDRHCGDHYRCCEKEWCDLTRECGRANFCLPDCQLTKMTHLSSANVQGGPLIDLVYD